MKKQVSMLLISLMVGIASASAQEMKKVDKHDKFQKQRVEVVAKQLELTDAQKAKFQEALAKNQKDMMEVRQRCEARLKKALTTEQFEKYQLMMKEQKHHHGEQKHHHDQQMKDLHVQQKKDMHVQLFKASENQMKQHK